MHTKNYTPVYRKTIAQQQQTQVVRCF